MLEERAEDLLLRLEVADTGSGIAPEQMSRLFQVFAQADASLTRAHGGNGLGLVITRRLAQLMGGDAGADSTPGTGNRFWFTARLRRASSALSAAPGAVPACPGDEAARSPSCPPAIDDVFAANRSLLQAVAGATAMRLGRQVATYR